MITTMHSDQNASPPRVEVITSVQRRRRWTPAEKIRPVEETMQPGIAEAFVKTFKRDYARLSILPDAETVIALLPAWFADYNEVRPHSGLKFLSPREFPRLSA
jgi:transposase InsO family protein